MSSIHICILLNFHQVRSSGVSTRTHQPSLTATCMSRVRAETQLCLPLLLLCLSFLSIPSLSVCCGATAAHREEERERGGRRDGTGVESTQLAPHHLPPPSLPTPDHSQSKPSSFLLTLEPNILDSIIVISKSCLLHYRVCHVLDRNSEGK